MHLSEIKKVSLLGVGFMGASLALDLKKYLPQAKITAYAHRRGLLRKLKKLSAIDFATTSLQKATQDSDLIVLAAPVGVIADYFSRINPFLKRGAYVIDLGSTKVMINKAAKRDLSKKVYFVGCHPLAGSEKKGLDNAVKDLYHGSPCIITSKAKQSKLIYDFWQKIGCKTYYLSPSVHDKLLAMISHLPHLIAYALAGYTPPRHKRFSTRSYQDLTRIANSSAKIWTDILLSNKDNLISDIDGYVDYLNRFRKLIKLNNRDKLNKLIEDINRGQNKHQR